LPISTGMSWNNLPPAVSVMGAQPSTCLLFYEPQNPILVKNIIGAYRCISVHTAADITRLKFYSDLGWCVQSWGDEYSKYILLIAARGEMRAATLTHHL